MSYNWYKTSKIKKEKNKWKVTDESGKKNLGEYDSKEDAVDRLRQVEYFKHKSSSNYLKILESLDDLDKLFLKNNTDFIKKLASTLTIENGDHTEIKNFKIKSIASLSPLFSSNNIKASEYWIDKNKEKINEILSAWGQLGFECYANREDVNIDKYDLIIFDADNTIWEGTCARDMTPPFYKLDTNTVKDSKGNICQLMNGVRETLLKLRAKGKDVGMISHSENESESHEKQPVILLLRAFGIFELFNDIIVIAQDLPKDIFIPKNRNVLFVDDKDNNLSDVIENTNADVVKAGEEINFEASVDNNIKKAISNENAYLRDYLKNGFDPYDFSYFIKEYLDSKSIDYDDDMEYYDIFEEWIQKASKDQIEDFKNYTENNNIYDGLDGWNSPPYSAMDFTKYISPTWMIHFTNDAQGVADNGFVYGHEEMKEGLHLTTHKVDRYQGSGYNFSFEFGTREASNAARSGKYGEEAVLFWSDGVQVSHWGDEEEQIIFWGPSVNKSLIFPITRDYGNWTVIDEAGRNVFTSEDFNTTVSWCVDNINMLQSTRSKALRKKNHYLMEKNRNNQKAEKNNWYKTSRSYIPQSERPDKPKAGKDYELDHLKSRWKGGKDKKDNLQWVEKEKHKKKSQEEGSFQEGGKDRHRKLKDKGKSNYSKYQSDCGKAKIEKEKEELGDKGFSQKQRERALKRWNKAFSSTGILKESTLATYRNELINDEDFVHAMETMQGCDVLIDFANAEREYENRIMESTDNREVTKRIMISLIKSFSKELAKHANEGTCTSIVSLIKTYF